MKHPLTTIALLITLILAAFAATSALGTALENLGVNRHWALVIVLTSSAGAYALGRAISARQKRIQHQRWIGGLGEGFAQKLDEARREARQGRSK